MAIVGSNLTSGRSPNGSAAYLTASITPTANRLIVAAVTHAFSTGPNVPTLSGAGMTWELGTTLVDAGNVRRLNVFRALSETPGTGAVTIDFGGETQIRCSWSIDEFSGVDTGGSNGANAVVQIGTAIVTDAGAQTGLTVTLAAFANANNGAYGALRHGNSGAITPGTGFTELAEQNQADTIETEWRDDNDTSVDWTWASDTTISLGIGMELGAAPIAAVSVGYKSLLGVGI